MVNPTHPGESIRNCIDESGWTVTECAARLGVTRNNLSRLLNGRIGDIGAGCSGTGSHRLEATRNSGCVCKPTTNWRKNAASRPPREWQWSCLRNMGE